MITWLDFHGIHLHIKTYTVYYYCTLEKQNRVTRKQKAEIFLVSSKEQYFQNEDPVKYHACSMQPLKDLAH